MSMLFVMRGDESIGAKWAGARVKGVLMHVITQAVSQQVSWDLDAIVAAQMVRLLSRDHIESHNLQCIHRNVPHIGTGDDTRLAGQPSLDMRGCSLMAARKHSVGAAPFVVCAFGHRKIDEPPPICGQPGRGLHAAHCCVTASFLRQQSRDKEESLVAEWTSA